MTETERAVVTYHLDQLETLLDAREDKDGLMHLWAMKKILGASHGAAAHAGPKRGRKKKAEAGSLADGGAQP